MWNKLRMNLFALWLRMKIFFKTIDKKKMRGVGVVAAIVLAVAACIVLVKVFSNDSRYFYIDYNGNLGTAYNCEMIDAGLVCDRTYGGKIMVKQYWRGE